MPNSAHPLLMEIKLDTDTATLGDLVGLWKLLECVLNDRNSDTCFSLLRQSYHMRKNEREGRESNKK